MTKLLVYAGNTTEVRLVGIQVNAGTQGMQFAVYAGSGSTIALSYTGGGQPGSWLTVQGTTGYQATSISASQGVAHFSGLVTPAGTQIGIQAECNQSSVTGGVLAGSYIKAQVS